MTDVRILGHGGPRDGAGRKAKDPAACKVPMSVSLAPDCIEYLATQPIKALAIESALRAQRDRLFEVDVKPPKPVPPARVMMALIDAGDADGSRHGIARFECPRCLHQTDWITLRSAKHGHIGHPCPKCKVKT